MVVSFYLERNKKTSGDRSIWVYIGERGTKIFINTGEKISENYWDKDNQRPKIKKRGSNELKHELSAIKNVIDDLEKRVKTVVLDLKSKRNTVHLEDIKEEVRDILKGKEGKTFFDYYDEFINERKIKLSGEAIQKHKRTRDLVKEYDSRTTFQKINNSYLNGFFAYLVDTNGMIDNTAYKSISFFKTFLHWAIENEMTDNIKFKSFKLKYEKNEIIFLTEEELQQLQLLKIKDKKLKQVRDVFVFQCFTGVRYSDLENLTREDIVGSIWNLTTQKTKDIIRIPLNEVTLSILAKYSDLEKPLPVITNQRMNEYLKVLCGTAGIDTPVKIIKYQAGKRIEEVKPKHELTSTHTARRTFVSLSLMRGMQPKTIMKITGHKTFKMLNRYLEVTDKHIQNEYERVWGNNLRRVK